MSQLKHVQKLFAFQPLKYHKHDFTRGFLKAIILDASGTLSDAYAIAPNRSFVRAFRKHDIVVSPAQVRPFMGMAKRDHLRAMLNLDAVKSQLTLKINEDQLYQDVMDIQTKLMKRPKYSTLFPGVVDTLRFLREKHDIRLGMTTGFPTSIAISLKKQYQSQGLVLDSVVGSQPGLRGRPHPDMIESCLKQMGLAGIPGRFVLKVGDTPLDIQEGRNARCWTCGITHTSSLLNIDSFRVKIQDLDVEERVQRANGELRKSGAHFFAPTTASLDLVVNAVNHLIRNGSHPDVF